MIRSQISSSNREDALLNKLKQCVGEIQSNNNDKNNLSSRGYGEKYKSRQIKPYSTNVQNLNRSQKRYERNQQRYDKKRQHYQPRIVQNKQNLFSEIRMYARQQDHRHLSNTKKQELTLNSNQYFKNTDEKLIYFRPTQNREGKYSTSSKPLIELTDLNNNFTSVKRDLFENKSSHVNSSNCKNYQTLKGVSQSTKKRIAQRQLLLIEDQIMKKTPKKVYQGVRNSQILNSQEKYSQRLNLRKNQYFNQNLLHQRSAQMNYISNQKQAREKQNYSNEIIKRREQIQNNKKSQIQFKAQQLRSLHPKVTPQKIQSQRVSVDNSYSKNQFKKSEKMEKLKRITQMNEEINNRIRKIVDTFQNYLTQRQI